VDEELSQRRLRIYSSNGVPAAVSNPAVRIIEVTNACSAGQFDAQQLKLLQDWVSEGGILWVSNDVLKLFDIRYLRIERDNAKWPCTVSDAADVAPLVGQSKKVTLTGLTSNACILAAKGVMPLLLLENGDASQHQPKTACWSVVRYGKGWISDRKAVDLTQDDGGKFWENFCRFCLRKEAADLASEAESPVGGSLAGTWQASKHAQFRIDDDSKTLTIDLLRSDALERLTGRLIRRDGPLDSQSFSGILDAVFKADPNKHYSLDVTATLADPGHLRLRCTNWPKWSSQGKFLGKDTMTAVWARAEGVFEPPAHSKKPTTLPPSW
jgi:hypothetical protein